jgi:restriction endonuclease
MARNLYLIEAKARSSYTCEACGTLIRSGKLYFRHDPFPRFMNPRGRRAPRTHWCRECIHAAEPGLPDKITGRLLVPVVRVVGARTDPGFRPLRIEIVGITDLLIQQLAVDPSLLYQISPDAFEELVCDRLFSMGLEPKRVGTINQRDGGIDILFWPRMRPAFPFLGAAQVKHHTSPATKEGPTTVRDFAGVMARHPLNAGLFVTNTTFTPDAKWFAEYSKHLIRLRDFADVSRWLKNDFGDEEWRDLPTSLEVCPGVIVKLR